MKTRKLNLCTTLSAVALLVPAAAARTIETTARPVPLPTSEAEALRARFGTNLDSLRAGGIETPSSIRGAEREALKAAETQSPGLEEMRAGGPVGLLLLLVLVVLVLLLL